MNLLNVRAGNFAREIQQNFARDHHSLHTNLWVRDLRYVALFY